MEEHKIIEKSIIKKYRKEIWSKFIRAVNDYELIKENDNIMVCISIPYIFNASKGVFTKMNVIMLLIFYVAFYIFSIVISGTQEVIPYSSSILGI